MKNNKKEALNIKTKDSRFDKLKKVISYMIMALSYITVFFVETMLSMPSTSFSVEFLIVFAALFLTTFDWSVFSIKNNDDKEKNISESKMQKSGPKLANIRKFIISNNKAIVVGLITATIFIPGMPILAVLIAISAIFLIAQIIDIFKSEEATAENGVTISKTKTRIAKVFTLANTIIAGLLVFASMDSISELVGVENIFGAEAASIDTIASFAICLIFAIIMNSIANGFKDSFINVTGSIQDRNKGLSKTKKAAIGLAMFAGIGLLVLPTIALFSFLAVDLGLSTGLAGIITAAAVLFVGTTCSLILARESKKKLETISNAIAFFKTQSPAKKVGIGLIICLMAAASYYITAAADYTGIFALDALIAVSIFLIMALTLILAKVPDMREPNLQKSAHKNHEADMTELTQITRPVPAKELDLTENKSKGKIDKHSNRETELDQETTLKGPS